MHIIHGFKTDCTTAIPKDPPINDLILLIITSWIDYEPIFSTRLWNFKFNNNKKKKNKKKKKKKNTRHHSVLFLLPLKRKPTPTFYHHRPSEYAFCQCNTTHYPEKHSS